MGRGGGVESLQAAIFLLHPHYIVAQDIKLAFQDKHAAKSVLTS